MAVPVSLLADIGGTRARFALRLADGTLSAPRVVDVAAYPGPVEAIAAYLDELGAPPVRAAALAIAAPVDAGDVRLTNGLWTFRRDELRARLGLTRLLLLNDFTALALALPQLPAQELRQIGGGVALPTAPKAVVGPGTGLGVSGLVHVRGHWLALSGEGGHATLAPADAREAALLALAWREFPHVSVERLVSGSGLPLLHRLVAEVDGRAAAESSPAAIVDAAIAGDPAAAATIDTFAALLGTLAGNLALTLGARGGVYLGGGIVPRLGERFARTPFRARFEAKGRFAPYLATVPAYVILSPAPALLGAAQALDAADQDA